MLMVGVGSAPGQKTGPRWLLRPKRIWAAGLVVAAIVALTAGCGQPEFKYVSNTDDQMYFKVPSSWHEIDGGAVTDGFSGEVDPSSMVAAAQKQLWWSVAYDSDADPSPDHMTTILTSSEPVLYATIRHQLPAQQDQVSFDTMRDMFVPVSETQRQLAAQAGVALDGFELLYDQVLTGPNGVHGVRVVFNYQFPTGILHTFDQTAYANQDSSVLYFLLIRCTAKCYRDRVDELNNIANSFTVRSKA
jgi:hypothetical protein